MFNDSTLEDIVPEMVEAYRDPYLIGNLSEGEIKLIHDNLEMLKEKGNLPDDPTDTLDAYYVEYRIPPGKGIRKVPVLAKSIVDAIDLASKERIKLIRHVSNFEIVSARMIAG